MNFRVTNYFLIGPNFPPLSFNANAYREFLQNQMNAVLEDVSVATK